MARKKSMASKQTRMIASLVAAVLGVAAILFLFAPAVVYKLKVGDATTNYSGFQMMFGYTQKVGDKISVETKVLNFNFVAFLGFIFLIAAIVTSIFNSKNLLIGLLPTLLFVLAAVMLFIMPAVFGIGYAPGADALELVKKAGSFGLGWGAIVAAICAILGAAVTACKALFLK